MTLTAGSNLFTDDPTGPYAAVRPCLQVNGNFDQPYSGGTGHNSALALIGPFFIARQFGSGNSCAEAGAFGAKIYLNVPTAIQFELTSLAAGGLGFTSSAALTGFKFFGSGTPCGPDCRSSAPLQGAAYTFTLNDTLPPAPIPEPDTVLLMAGPLAMLLLLRTVHRYGEH